MATGVDTLDKLQRLDHDTITRLEVKMDSLITGQRDMGQLVDGKFITHETRLNKLEAIVESVKPEQTYAEFREVQKQVNDMFVMAKTLKYLIVTQAGIIVFLIIQLPGVLKNLGVLH